MSEHESTTIANTDLWGRYFQDEWSRWLNPFGVKGASPVSQLADGTAARVAGFLTLVAAGPIAWLYSENPGRVTQIVGDEQHTEERSLELAGSVV